MSFILAFICVYKRFHHILINISKHLCLEKGDDEKNFHLVEVDGYKSFNRDFRC